MRKERFDFVRQDVEAGIDAFVIHPSTREEGRVLSYSDDYVTVETSTGEKRCWDYHECEEMSRSKEEWPWR
ncbi:hypothetical protein [Desulfuromonas sp. TF]|jgi:hypothetical protein|uniref:hypothetical protein n=1 Tax=Desulfuromonas sp. TF TaxID=1232410 RepID=UPI000426C49F|nr:hypothetical protein [Desulfuromonas sp. TF]